MPQLFDRRRFLKTAGAVTLGFGGLHSLLDAATTLAANPAGRAANYGPLVPDPQKILDLPAGFRYTVISRTGETMNDGLLVPGRHDGMNAFPGPGGKTVLVRNHENAASYEDVNPFGKDFALFAQVDARRVYDAGYNKTPAMGGTTRLLFDTAEQKLVGHEMSLAGTVRNCSGGPTPWNTWLTCEESVQVRDQLHECDHGFVFEVPSTYGAGLAQPRPLLKLGRFYHEAVTIDPRSSVIYLTEDREDGLLYRSRLTPGKGMREIGPLQALRVKNQSSLDTRNWFDESPRTKPGVKMAVEWITLNEILAPKDDLRYRGFGDGAAKFARGEGAWHSNDAVYFAMTNGGEKKCGQIWRYFPSPFEGTPKEAEQPGMLELFVESKDRKVLDCPDNLTISPWGDLFTCEDGKDDQFVVGVTPKGELYQFARNALNNIEFCGGCFSPDGTTFFVNIQIPGLTLAITGPWRS